MGEGAVSARSPPPVRACILSVVLKKALETHPLLCWGTHGPGKRIRNKKSCAGNWASRERLENKSHLLPSTKNNVNMECSEVNLSLRCSFQTCGQTRYLPKQPSSQNVLRPLHYCASAGSCLGLRMFTGNEDRFNPWGWFHCVLTGSLSWSHPVLSWDLPLRSVLTRQGARRQKPASVSITSVFVPRPPFKLCLWNLSASEATPPPSPADLSSVGWPREAPRLSPCRRQLRAPLLATAVCPPWDHWRCGAFQRAFSFAEGFNFSPGVI